MQTILRETTRTSHLVDNLLLLARADSDQDTFPADPVELNSLLGEAVDRARQLANDATVNISTNIGEAPVIVSGDAGLLQRLFLILIDNALKYTPQNGSVTVSLDANGNHATVAVVDTGIGIAPADLPHIFDRFWRADKVRSRDVGGTGLGLSIARWIVARNGGTLHVESVLGKGSRFEVRLPRLQTGSQN
jgi:signal transduction histidine kinase